MKQALGEKYKPDVLNVTKMLAGTTAARLFVSSETTDADLFLAIRLFDPNGKEVLFIETNDPRVCVGSLRASGRSRIYCFRSFPSATRVLTF